jgi:hypothetical protein
MFMKPTTEGFGSKIPDQWIEKSLRFRASNSAYLSRTFGTPTNNLKWTYSTWVKRGALSVDCELFNSGAVSSDDQLILNATNDTLAFFLANGASYYQLSTARYRDPSAWLHVVLVFDSANLNSGERIQLYVNGQRLTATSGTQPTLSYVPQINSAIVHRIGARSNASYVLDGYLSEVNFIDGQALTPESFGRFDANGQWRPKKFIGTYGNNGFYLPFNDSSNLPTSLGYDKSGGTNNWASTGISTTPGVTYDWMNDTPTNNYATLNPLVTASSGRLVPTFSNGNSAMHNASAAQDADGFATMVIPNRDMWYWEVVCSGQSVPAGIGIGDSTLRFPDNTVARGRAIYSGGGNTSSTKWTSGTGLSTNYSPGFQNKTVSIALDMVNGAFYVAVDGTWLDSGVPTSGASKTGAIHTDVLTSVPFGGNWVPWAFCYNGTTLTWNFGQRPFQYTPPAGFKALCSRNIQ